MPLIDIFRNRPVRVPVPTCSGPLDGDDSVGREGNKRNEYVYQMFFVWGVQGSILKNQIRREELILLFQKRGQQLGELEGVKRTFVINNCDLFWTSISVRPSILILYADLFANDVVRPLLNFVKYPSDVFSQGSYGKKLDGPHEQNQDDN